MAGKAELVNSIVDSVDGISRRQATAAFDAVFGAISGALKAGESAKIPGFGSFSVSERGARKGRNPATGESITIKASKGVRFKVGKELEGVRQHQEARPQVSRSQSVLAKPRELGRSGASAFRALLRIYRMWR